MHDPAENGKTARPAGGVGGAGLRSARDRPPRQRRRVEGARRRRGGDVEKDATVKSNLRHVLGPRASMSAEPSNGREVAAFDGARDGRVAPWTTVSSKPTNEVEMAAKRRQSERVLVPCGALSVAQMFDDVEPAAEGQRVDGPNIERTASLAQVLNQQRPIRPCRLDAHVAVPRMAQRARPPYHVGPPAFGRKLAGVLARRAASGVEVAQHA